MSIDSINRLRVNFTPSTTSGSVTTITDSNHPIQNVDLSYRQGYRKNYSIRDAATNLWRQGIQIFSLTDMEEPKKATGLMENIREQSRWDMEPNQCVGETKDEVISQYIQVLRQNGLNGTVNWNSLSMEFKTFKIVTPEELDDGLNYLASRYVAVLDKLERNYDGKELTFQRAKLEAVYQMGKNEMIDGYAQLFQDCLGISSSDAQVVKDSLSAILEEKVNAYRDALRDVDKTISRTGLDNVWLKNHDAYIAFQLRVTGAGKQSETPYSVQDLTLAGQLAQRYQTEIINASTYNRNEATLALNLSMTDMQAETIIQKGLVNQNMAVLLRSSRTQGHENALNALNQTLAVKENNRTSGEPDGTFAPVDRTVFDGIYQTVMGAYQHSGGNAVEAIRAGATYGQKLTDQATAKNPNAQRWGVSIDYYWKNFYKASDIKETSPMEHRVNKLLEQIGRTPTRNSSTYQKYMDRWRNFLTAVGGGSALNIRV